MLTLSFVPLSSVCISAGLGHMLGPHDLPAYTLPFNIATSIIFLGMQGAGFGTPPSTTTLPELTTPASTPLLMDAAVNGSGGVLNNMGVLASKETDEEVPLEWEKVREMVTWGGQGVIGMVNEERKCFVSGVYWGDSERVQIERIWTC